MKSAFKPSSLINYFLHVAPFIFGLASMLAEPLGIGKKGRLLERKMLLEPRFKKTGGIYRFWLRRVLNGEFLLWKNLGQFALLAAIAFLVPGLNKFAVGFVAGMAVGGLTLISPIFKKYKDRVRLETGIRAAEKLSYLYSPEETTELLLPIAASKSAVSKIVAIHGLKKTGTTTAKERLEALTQDKDIQVAEAAKESNLAMLDAMLGQHILSVIPLEIYVAEHSHWRKKARSNAAINNFATPSKINPSARSGAAFKDDPIEKLKETTQSIDEIVYSQMGIRRSFPDVYCKNCYARGETQSYMHWDWVRCRKCKDAHHLVPRIEKVVARIGSETDWQLENGELSISIWNENSRQARYAEPDRIEIIGGKSINYDWAVSAVVSKLHDEGQGYGWKIEIQLKDNPSLEANSLQLLRNLDPSFLGED